jgi:hypothetical protein
VDTKLYVLDIQDPSAIVLVVSKSLPTLNIFLPLAFLKKDNYLYFAHQATVDWLSACELLPNKDIQVLNHIVVPDRIRMFDISNNYTLAVSWYAAFLINLQYPESPCISEETEFGGIDGTINGDYIFLLWPCLSVFQITQVE